MKRYVNITDIRGTRTWAHHASSRLYMYMCMTCDWTNGHWSGTRRRVALELGLSDQEYRTAMKNLALDGLIEAATDEPLETLHTPTQQPTHHTTQRPTQRATQVTVVIYKELGGGISPKEQPNMQPKQQPKEQPSNNNNNTHKPYSLTLARAKAASLIDDVAEYIHSDREDAKCAIRAFLDAMSKKQKTWIDEGDFIAHLMDWTLKQWLKVDSRLSAQNKQQERAERHQRDEQENDPLKVATEEAKRKIEWLIASTRSDRARELVTAWHRQGAWTKEPLKSMTSDLLAKEDQLRRQLHDTLGFDVVVKKAG